MAEALLIPQFEQDLSDYALKSYVDTAVANKDVGVTTFNGRKGAVSPQSGDYTYSMVGAASSGHGHSGTYADYSHTHNYAAASHTHSYAASNHTHDYAASNHTHTVTGTSHTHTGYASSTHSHSEYSSSSHTHSGYASSTHTHSYASSSHTHSGYATQDWVIEYVKNNGGGSTAPGTLLKTGQINCDPHSAGNTVTGSATIPACSYVTVTVGSTGTQGGPWTITKGSNATYSVNGRDVKFTVNSAGTSLSVTVSGGIQGTGNWYCVVNWSAYS